MCGGSAPSNVLFEILRHNMKLKIIPSQPATWSLSVIRNLDIDINYWSQHCNLNGLNCQLNYFNVHQSSSAVWGLVNGRSSVFIMYFDGTSAEVPSKNKHGLNSVRLLCYMLTDLMGGSNLQFAQLVITGYNVMSQFLLLIYLCNDANLKLRRRCKVSLRGMSRLISH